MKNPAGFIFPHTDTPKTCSVLHPNLRRGYLRGVCNTPLHGYVKNLLGFTFPHPNTPKTHPVSYSPSGYTKNPLDFRRKPSARGFSGRMLSRPYTGTCKTHPILDPNPWRRTFWGVCNTPLHGYPQNLAGFIFPHTDAPKTHPILPSQIGVHPKPTRF